MIYKVTYQSMTAFYGPSYIEAETELEAINKFAGTAFRSTEKMLIKAVPVSGRDIRRALHRNDEEA